MRKNKVFEKTLLLNVIICWSVQYMKKLEPNIKIKKFVCKNEKLVKVGVNENKGMNRYWDRALSPTETIDASTNPLNRRVSLILRVSVVAQIIKFLKKIRKRAAPCKKSTPKKKFKQKNILHLNL